MELHEGASMRGTLRILLEKELPIPAESLKCRMQAARSSPSLSTQTSKSRCRRSLHKVGREDRSLTAQRSQCKRQSFGTCGVCASFGKA